MKKFLISGLVDEKYRIKINLLAISPDHAIKVFQQKYPKAKGVISYHTNVVEVSDIINKTRPRLTILNHVLSLDGSSDDEILNLIKQNTKHDVLIAKDLMTIDVKDDIYIYKQKNL